jgi:hypothetical protein
MHKALTHIHSPYVYVCAVVYPNLLYLDLHFSFSPAVYYHQLTPSPPPLPYNCNTQNTSHLHFNHHIGITIFFLFSLCKASQFFSRLVLRCLLISKQLYHQACRTFFSGSTVFSPYFNRMISFSSSVLFPRVLLLTDRTWKKNVTN